MKNVELFGQDNCDLCGELLSGEVGEFVAPESAHPEVEFTGHVIAHAQCGLDHELELA